MRDQATPDDRRAAHDLYCSLSLCGGDPNCFNGLDEYEQELWIKAFAKFRARIESGGWQPIETAPTDGSHFLIALGGTFGYLDGKALPSMQAVVHYFLDPDEPGFYLSSGLVSGSYNDHPQKGTHWKPLDSPV